MATLDNATMPTFEEVFLSLEPDILTGVVKHLCSKTRSENEIEENTHLIFNYFAINGKTLELVEWLLTKEIFESKDPHMMFLRNSIYNKFIRIFMDYELKDIIQDVIDRIVEQIIKKDICINLLDPDTKLSDSDLKRFKELLSFFFSKLYDLKLPDSFHIFLSDIGSLIMEYYPDHTISVLNNIIFTRYISTAIATTKPQKQPEKTSMTLKSISLVIRWILSSELKTDFEWQKNLQDIVILNKTNLMSWLTNIIITPYDKPIRVKPSNSIKLTRDLKKMIFDESESICLLLNDSCARVLRILKDQYCGGLQTFSDLFMKLQMTLTEQETDIFNMYSQIAILKNKNKELLEQIKFFETRTQNDQLDNNSTEVSQFKRIPTKKHKLKETEIASINAMNKTKMEQFFSCKKDLTKDHLTSPRSNLDARSVDNQTPVNMRSFTYNATPFTTPGLSIPTPSLGSSVDGNVLGVSLFDNV
ncbi:GTPase-activator protein for Ras family GTPase [Entamoeba marina]